MPKFEAQSREIAAWNREERARMMEWFRVQCCCPKCPTHTECAKRQQEKVFCTHGRSFICIDTEVECLCPGCPVHEEMGLKHTFFCTRGSEKAQRYEHEIWNIQH